MLSTFRRNRRTAERLRVPVPVRLETTQGPVVGKTTNISLGGALVEVELGATEAARIPERTTMDIIVDEDQLSFDILVSRRDGHTIAVEFVRIRSGEDYRKLRLFLESHLSNLTADH